MFWLPSASSDADPPPALLLSVVAGAVGAHHYQCHWQTFLISTVSSHRRRHALTSSSTAIHSLHEALNKINPNVAFYYVIPTVGILFINTSSAQSSYLKTNKKQDICFWCSDFTLRVNYRINCAIKFVC